MITYRLSGRQVKEIGARGQRLRIAIPEPPDLPDDVDLIEFARAALPGAPGEIVEAERTELTVEAAPGTPGLAGVLGAIQERPRGLSWLVPAIVATIRPAFDQRRQQMDQRIQWPASAHDEDGRRWPRGSDDAQT